MVQAGELILFAMADGVVTAHIQIQYDGDAAEFGWLVPLPKALVDAVREDWNGYELTPAEFYVSFRRFRDMYPDIMTDAYPAFAGHADRPALLVTDQGWEL